MDTRQVLLVDAFADGPLGGRPIAVVPGETPLSETQRQQVGSELGTGGIVHRDDGEIRYTATGPTGDVLEGAIAGCAGLFDFDQLTGTEWAIDTERGQLTVERVNDGRYAVEQTRPTVEPADIDKEIVATALGIDVASLQDVGADLPIGLADSAGGSLLVPVNFFEHLGRVSPDSSALSALLSDVSASRLVVFTFDTLSGDADVHARVFTPNAGGEQPTAGTALSDTGVYLDDRAVFDGGREAITIESGHFLDRPGRVMVEPGEPVRVLGHAVTTLEGELTLPEPDDEDDIIEL